MNSPGHPECDVLCTYHQFLHLVNNSPPGLIVRGRGLRPCAQIGRDLRPPTRFVHRTKNGSRRHKPTLSAPSGRQEKVIFLFIPIQEKVSF